MNSSNTNAIWENIYESGEQLNHYPYDFVVSFLFHYKPQKKARQDTHIFEFGCGAGNNLWFAAREGFQVSGLDSSLSAIDYAKKRFQNEGLKGDLRVGDFTLLPFTNQSFDMVIDRGALTNVSLDAVKQSIREAQRVLLPGGKFLFNPYSDRNCSYVSGKTRPDGLTDNIQLGLVGMGGIRFYSRRELLDIFSDGWKILSLQHMERVEMLEPQYLTHAEWRVVAEKVS